MWKITKTLGKNKVCGTFDTVVIYGTHLTGYSTNYTVGSNQLVPTQVSVVLGSSSWPES